MKIVELLKNLPNLKREKLLITRHFRIRHDERKDSQIPGIDEIYNTLVTSDPVEISIQGHLNFKILYNLNDHYDLTLVISVKNISPEIEISLITCYKRTIERRVRKE